MCSRLVELLEVVVQSVGSARVSTVRLNLTYGTSRMVDPLSLAGLTLAICDELLKLGERTAELVRDIRAFDEVCVLFCIYVYTEH